MKRIACLILGVIAASCAHAQLSNAPTPEWKVTLKIVDDNGKPVADAKTVVGYGTNHITGLTDTNGIFFASHRDKSYSLGFLVTKDGYYLTRQTYDLGWAYQYNEAKWNPTKTIVLRKIGNPISMYAKRQEMKFPKLDEPVAFDLMTGDWVTPYGKGEHVDMFFTAHRKIINNREFNAQLTVTFPNKGDGIAVASSEPAVGSEFKTSRTATKSGYEPTLVLDFSNSKRPDSVFGYFIRVRTELDQDSNVKSALYGKIAGNFRFYAGTIAPTSGMGFDYYLNPTPNDRNVEFDPKKNMVRDLKPLEGVSEP